MMPISWSCAFWISSGLFTCAPEPEVALHLRSGHRFVADRLVGIDADEPFHAGPWNFEQHEALDFAKLVAAVDLRGQVARPFLRALDPRVEFVRDRFLLLAQIVDGLVFASESLAKLALLVVVE